MTTQTTITTAPDVAYPRLGTTGWCITGKTADGGICDHCARTLKHCYTVTNPPGEEMTVGRGCVKVLTGWTLTAGEAGRLVWQAEREVLRATNWAAFTAAHPEVAAEIEADCNRRIPAAHHIRQDISDGDVRGWELKYAQSYLDGR